ncbi:MAG: hypothetical protein JWN62_1333 [Acidimicrobiales bacterium]|nr:hypothetical protein [Acidimicrobiales bacterium]
MATLHIEHPITDFTTWSTAFERFADARRNAGVLEQRVLRPIDDGHFVMVQLDFDSIDAAVAFKEFLTTIVWTNPDNAPGLAGSPRALVADRPTSGA